MDLSQILGEGTMKAAVMIIAGHKLPQPTSEQLTALIAAMLEEIKAGYDEALQTSREALDSMGAEAAKHSLNVFCNLFAVRALRSAGILSESLQLD